MWFPCVVSMKFGGLRQVDQSDDVLLLIKLVKPMDLFLHAAVGQRIIFVEKVCQLLSFGLSKHSRG